jgi:hypothetical protein
MISMVLPLVSTPHLVGRGRPPIANYSSTTVYEVVGKMRG